MQRFIKFSTKIMLKAWHNVFIVIVLRKVSVYPIKLGSTL